MYFFLQVLDDLLKTVISLSNHSLLNEYNYTVGQVFFRKISNVSDTVTKEMNRCQNLTKMAKKLSNKSISTSKRVDELSLKQKSQEKQISKVINQIKEIKSLNETGLIKLQKSLQESRSAFDSLNIKKAIVMLNASYSAQQTYIDNYKEKVKGLRNEVMQLKELYLNFKSAKGCD